MSDNLTQVMLEFSANFDSFDATLRRAENRAKLAGQNIEKALKVKSGVIDPGGRSIVTGKAPTPSSQAFNKTVVNVERSNDPNVIKEGSATRSALKSLEKSQKEAIKSIGSQISGAVKSSASTNIFNQLKSALAARTIDPVLSSAGKITASITDSAFAGLKKQFETFADLVSADMGASLKSVRDPLTATVADAMMFGAKEGAVRIADEIARAVSESFGLFEAETFSLQRAQKNESGGNKSVRSVIATGKDLAILDKQIKDFGIVIGGLKRSLSAMEKQPELKVMLQQRSTLTSEGVGSQAKLIQAKLQKDLAQNNFNDLRSQASEVMTSDASKEEKLLFKKRYQDAEKLLALETANVSQLNLAETQRKQALFKIEQSALVKKYDNKRLELNDAESDKGAVEARKAATVELFDQSVMALDAASSNGLMQSRDELTKAYAKAKQDLAALKIDKNALEEINSGKDAVNKLQEKVTAGEDRLTGRRSTANKLKNAFFEEQDPEAKAALEKKYKTTQKGIQKIESNLKKNKAALTKAEEAVTAQISALNSSGYMKLQDKTDTLGQELALIGKILSRRSSAKLPKLMQDIIKELNVTVKDMDKLPKIEFISQKALDSKSNKKGSTGNFDSSTNTISVLKDLKGEMDKGIGEVSDDIIGILTHELTHSLQTNFGSIQISDILSGSKAPKLLIKQASITKDELKAVAGVIKSYQAAGANANEIAVEMDAFISQLRIQKKNRKVAVTKKAPELIDAGKQGIIQLYAQVNKALPNLSDKIEAKGALGQQFENDAKAMLKKANEFKSSFEATGSMEMDLNLDVVYTDLMNMVQELNEFKTKTEKALTEAQKESDLVKKKDSIRSRIGQGVKNKLAFQTTVTPHNGESKGSQLVLAGSKAIGGALFEATKDVYQLASGTEAAAMAMFPLLKGVKTVTQVLGATAIAASVPGSGLLLEGAQAVIAPAIDLAATGISGMVGGAVEGAIVSASGVISGAIAESGVIGAASIAGALTSAGATIAASAGSAAAGVAGIGATGALTAGAVAIPTVAAVKGVNNGISSIMGDTTKAKANGERVAKNLGLLAGAVNENFLATKSQLKSLAPAKGADKAQLQASYSKQVFLLKGQIDAAEEALNEAQGDKTATRLIKETRKKLLGMLKTRQNQATAAGVEIVDNMPNEPKMKRVRQVTVVDEAINAGKKGAKLAKDFSDGFSQTIDATTDFWDSAEGAANKAVKGFAKGQDSASPSKKMKRLAKDFRDGFVLSIATDKNFFRAAKDAAEISISGFNRPFLDEANKPSRLRALKIEAETIQVPGKLQTQNKRPQNDRDNYADYLKDYNALAGEVDSGRVADTTNEEILAGQVAAKKGLKGLLDYAALGQVRVVAGMKKVAKSAAVSLADASVSLTGGVSDTTMSEVDNRILTATARVEQHLTELDRAERLISEMENYQPPAAPKNKYAGRASRVLTAAVGANTAGDAGAAVGESVGDLKNQLGLLLGQLRINPAIGEFFAGINKGFNTTGKGALKFKAQLAAALTLTGLLMIKNQIISVGKALFNTALEMEVVQKKLNSVNMGGQDPFKTFGASANKAGLSVKDYASNFAGMVQTMNRSVPNADKVFESITEGLNKRGVVGDAMTRSMEALSQISSKGVVSMEELRQQLGEALPGAMTIAADSMGMTNGQFMKMVESGEMLSSDFLPKFGMALNNVAGGDLPSLNTELQTAKNNIDGILAQSASTIPFTGALQSFNAVVSQSAGFLKLFIPLLGVGLAGAALSAGGVLLYTAASVTILGTALKAALIGGGAVAALAAIGVAAAGLIQYLKGAGTEFDRIGEKMDKALNPDVAKKSRLAATGTIARLNDSLTSFFTPGQSSKFAEKETIEVRGQANRQIQKQQDAINKSAKKLTEDNIKQTNKQVSPLVVEKQKLQIKLSNADALGLSQDAKKNITKSINDIDAEIKGIVEKNLGSEIDVNTVLKATLESKATLEADAKARGEDVAVLYGAQYQNLVKQEQVLKSMVAQFAAVAGFSNNQLKAQKEMNSLLGLGTKVSEKEGVMETLAAYKELESLTTTMAGFDSASMVIDIAVKEGAVKEIEAQISSIDAFVSTSMGTAQEQVINKAFKNGWKKATAKEIADFKIQIESGALGEVDKAVVSMVESLEKKSDLEKELGQTNIDLIKANRQLEQALLDLNDARLNQQMQGNQTEMSLIQLVADLQKMSPENSKEVFDAGNSNIDFRLQQQESLRNLSVSFRSFGESLTDAADSLKSGIASMNEEIRATAASLKTTALSGASAFANAAGIEDKLGLNRLADLAAEKINIQASDKTASIERQQASENKTDKRQIRDFTEQRDGLNREADRASMEIVRAIENNNFDMKDLEVNFELSGLQLQDKLDSAVRDVTGLERSTNEFNDRALGFGQAPVDVDISGLKNRLANIQTMVLEGADSGAIVQALYDLKVQQNADAQEFLSGIQATKVQGNQGLTQRINDITSLNKDKNAAFETQKSLEKERVQMELDLNAEKALGTIVDIKNKAKEAGLSAIKSAEGIGLTINSELSTVGLGANPYELLRMESKRWKRDTLADIAAQRKALKESVDMLGEGGNTADNKLNVVANLTKAGASPELIAQIKAAQSSNEVQAYVKQAQDALASLDVSERQVNRDADNAAARKVEQAKTKDALAKGNTLTGEKQSFLDSVDTSRLSSGEERELELAKKRLKINQDTANKIAQINEDAMMQPNLYGGDVQKNRTNMALEEQANLLKKAQKEASILNDIYANLSTAGADAIKSAILGIGEAILSNKPKQEEQDKLDADYAERLSSLVEGYTGSAEELQYAKDQLDNQRDDIQGEIDSKLSKTAQLFDVLKGALSGFAQSIAQVAAQMAATAAIKGIAGMFGGDKWSMLADSLIGGANMGGQAGVDVISNYSMGGTAGIKDALALQAGIGKAMQKEGQGAMPIVVHKGEQILTTKNGDAQLFRALKAQGEWDNIKQANVSNYANGGTAGYSSSAGGGYGSKRGMAANSNTYYSSNVTVVANDIGSFKKNEQALLRETEAAQTRSVRRGLG